jgi:hypothetical protein
MPSTVPQAVQSCHELLLWLIPQLDKFPRQRASVYVGRAYRKRSLIGR